MTGSGSGLKQEQQRSTVIVNPSTSSSSSYDLVKVNTDKSENEEKEKEEEDEGLLLPEMENIDMKDLKDIQTICMSFLAEEPPFMQEKQQLFYNAWYEVNILISMVSLVVIMFTNCNDYVEPRLTWRRCTS